MLIDFSEIKDWRQFEDLVCDLLEKEGFLIEERSGRGADEGRDIIAVGRFENPLERFERRYLVQCKSWKEPISEAEVPNVIDKMKQHNADSFLLVAYDIRSGLQHKLDGLKREGISIRYWLKRDIEKRLIEYNDIFKKHLPSSFERFFSVEGLISEAELIKLFNKKYGRNPRLDELIPWRKDTVNYGITDISVIEKVLNDKNTLESLNSLYSEHLGREVDPVGHLTWGYLLFNNATEETKKSIEFHIKNSDEYMGRTRILYWPNWLPKAEIQFHSLIPQRFFGWRPYHVAYTKGILRTFPDSLPPYIELESTENQEFRIEWSYGRNLLNKNTIAMDVAHNGFFQVFIFVVATNNRPYYIQYIFDEGEARAVNDTGVGYAQYFVGREFPLDAPIPKTLERNFSKDLMGLYKTEVGVLISLHFGVKGKARISRILLAE
jgi:hypothetical protein